MLERQDYKPKTKGLSSQNEPANDWLMTTNVRQYPDMYLAYQRFSQVFDLPLNTFFLGNGCENTIKNVLLALKPKSLCWGTPTWRMLDVYCEALEIKPIQLTFDYINKFIEPNIYNTPCEVLYTNCGYTTCFKYDFDSLNLHFSQSNYNICDVTYQNIDEIKNSIKILRNNPKNIIVGSFDKLVGCGLRLGFAIYPEELHHKMSLQREQYINALAYDWLITTDFNITPSKYKQMLKQYLSDNDCITDNYITIRASVVTNIPHHSFTVNGITFTRFGIPNNDSEYEALKILLKSL